MSAAKDDPAPGPSSGPPNAADAQARRQRLVDELKLDTGQQARLDEIFGLLRGRMAELREIPEADRRTRAERLRADVRQRINAMLNADQQTLYAEIVANETGRIGSSTGRVFVPGPDRNVVEVRLRLGLTDGNVTEVAGGDLKEGNEVVVGTLASGPGTKSGPAGAPRLPF